MAYMISPKGMNKCIGCLTCASVCAVANHDNHSIDKSAIRIRTTGGMGSDFVAIVCRSCEHPACAEVCPAGALELRPGGGVLLNAEKCFGCHRCVPACSVGAVRFDKETQKPIICCHCGICTTFCPHGCIEMVGEEDVEEVGENAQ